jgi:hypothetical protein
MRRDSNPPGPGPRANQQSPVNRRSERKQAVDDHRSRWFSTGRATVKRVLKAPTETEAVDAALEEIAFRHQQFPSS